VNRPADEKVLGSSRSSSRHECDESLHFFSHELTVLGAEMECIKKPNLHAPTQIIIYIYIEHMIVFKR